MITVYAIIASLLLGGFIRHNQAEIRANYKLYRSSKKFEKMIAVEKKKREAAEAKTPAIPEQR